jgi:hypothetical protein
MTSRHQSTRNSSSNDDLPSTLSSVYFEQWELRDSARNHSFIGNSAFFAGNAQTSKNARIPTNVLTCWEVNHGFTERGIIAKDFNELESWTKVVSPCCHCVSFKQDRPLKKKLLSFSSHHDVGLAERYKCQSLWEALYRPLYEKKKAACVKKKRRADTNDVSNLSTRTKKHKAKKKKSVELTPGVTPAVPVLNVEFTTSTGTEVGQSAVILPFDKAIKDLEAKLRAKYEYDLAQYKEEKEKVVESDVLKADALLAAACEEKRRLVALNSLASEEKQQLLREKRQLEGHNSSLLSDKDELLVENELVRKEKEKLGNRVEALRREKRNQQIRSCSHSYVKKLEDTTKDHLAVGVNRKYLAEKLADVVRGEAYGGLCGTHLHSKYCQEIQAANPYRDAMNVCRVMDLGSGQLNISGIEMLRKGIEGDEHGKVKYGGGWLTTKYYIQQAQNKVHGVAQKVIPFEEIPTPDLDGVAFKVGNGDDFSKILMFILEMFQLDHIARDPTQPPVQLACTLDGADISRFVSHVTAGIKILDPRAIDPMTNLPIGLAGSKKVQSRDLCFPFKMILTRDTKSLYQEHFKDFFDFFSRLNREGLPQLGIYPIMVSSPQDMSSMWKALGRGGGCKVKTFFCYCCAMTSKESATQRKIKCPSCVLSGRQKCFHSDTGDVATLHRLNLDLQQMTATHGFLQVDDTSGLLSKLQSHLDPSQFEKEKDASNIDFVPLSDNQKRDHYLNYLKPDLSRLGLSLMGSHTDRGNRLRTALELMTRKIEIETTMRVTGDDAGALLLLRQAIPCILHCENRCGEKFLKMFLLEIFNHFAGETKMQDQFLMQFEDYVNLNILGKPWRKGNWRLTTTQNSNKEKTIGDQGMPNTHVRRFMEAFDQLADNFLWYDEERKEQWKKSMSHWRKLMEMARQRDDFTDEEIDAFSTQCDDFFEVWVDLTGLEGMTNYIHMIGSGHMTYYLREWRNLYRYSQQGWEALNSLLKNIYFRRTQRGGHKGDGKSKNSKLTPIAKWLQRRLFFLSGKYKDIE